ncbi:succinate dehydrogenase assembly factor 2 [Agrobacterium vitis]|uniref:FAD assembly factor SdhE n=1 Tax=Agrobacterium vitis TaxID=373 RepID=A0AAE2REK1_AGRVI|nr:succinate dehydrogenase assembly factor 2 [Agrobacterium vitis]MBF2716024.1 succinate dehydrogenase assembly factor 2 [Agrobacterium vitis]MUZ66086.1 succinate dehydrogenase assembly factor 2 family protein [Agrobacterium vitis]MVA20895.1 succinate dehydrogenase assembly factor 2 family protein [Agrobacterium vitis]
MTGLVRSSADLDPRRRRILFRCWHRGIREMDLMLGQFAEAEISALNDAELDDLELIMAEEDNDLISWINGAAPVPVHMQIPLFDRIAATRPDFSPVDGLAIALSSRPDASAVTEK